MRIFLSYDDTRRDVAERLALGLRVAGHEVFFDQDSLPAGTSYDDRIRNAILRSHLFVFLISAESVRKGAYALTELDIAEQRRPHPTGRLLPVLLDETPISSLPTRSDSCRTDEGRAARAGTSALPSFNPVRN